MADYLITDLPETTTTTADQAYATRKAGTTYYITQRNIERHEVVNAGNVSGAVSVDLSAGKTFEFTLTGDIDVTLNNGLDGERYIFLVTNSGSNNVSSMTLGTGGNVYAEGGSLPNVTNNGTDIFEGHFIGNDLYLYAHTNFGVV